MDKWTINAFAAWNLVLYVSEFSLAVRPLTPSAGKVEGRDGRRLNGLKRVIRCRMALNSFFLFNLKCNVNATWSVQAMKPLICCQASEGFCAQTHTHMYRASSLALPFSLLSNRAAVWLPYQEPQNGYLTELLGRVNETKQLHALMHSSLRLWGKGRNRLVCVVGAWLESRRTAGAQRLQPLDEGTP